MAKQNTRQTLRGKTVLVTRPRSQATDLTRLLRRHGARVVAAPAIRISAPASWMALDRSLRDLKDYDILVFTSANGVARFFERAGKILKRGKPMKPRQLYAIGPGTAKALRSHGWRGVQVPEIYEGGALAHFLGPVRGRKILIPRARVARDILPKILRARGAQVDVVEAYRTLPDRAGLRRLRQAVQSGEADLITFTSSSTVEHFMSAVGPKSARKFFAKAVAASIGPITSKTLRHHGIRRIIQGDTYTTAGLVQAIINHVQQ